MSLCTDFPLIYTDLQLSLLALLPKDGTPMKVRALAWATDASSQEVADALFDVYMAGAADYHVRRDSFSLPLPKGAA